MLATSNLQGIALYRLKIEEYSFNIVKLKIEKLINLNKKMYTFINIKYTYYKTIIDKKEICD